RDGAEERIGSCGPDATAPAIADEGTTGPTVAPPATPAPPVPPSPAAADAPPADEVGTVLLHGSNRARVVLRTAA
ncbi:MAG: hypothetical protein KDA22_14345, partial [Phycisphaerales bacterium]|nr:hypothetical protein [Phycisphaerales bacterium]